MPAISTNGTVLTRLAGALYNTQMSNATYNEVKTLDPASLANALYARDFSSSTDLAVATTLVTNLGLTSVTGLANWVAAQLTAAGAANKGAKIVDLLNGFAQMTADATYGSFAAAFNTKVDAALAASQTTGNAGGTFAAVGVVVPTAPVDATFTLTAAVDLFNGGAGNDTFNASVGNTTTIQATDKIVGGAGNDVLNIAVDSNATATINGADVSGIETINVRAVGTGAPVALDASQAPGVTAVNADRGTGAFSVTNLASGASFGAIGNGVVTLGDLGVGYAAAATASTVNVSGGTVSTGTVTVSGTGLKDATVNSTGAANTIGALTLAASQNGTLTINATTALTTGAISNTTAAALTKLTVTGAGAVNTSTTALPTTVASVDASASTGGLTVVTGDTAAGTSTAPGLTILGSTTAADSIDIRASGAAGDYVSVTAGGGNDTVTVLNTQITTGSTLTLNGGDGTSDTLKVDFANANGTQAIDLSSKISGFETIEVISTTGGAAATATLAMGTNKLAISNFKWSGDSADSFALTGLAANSTINMAKGFVTLDATIGTNTTADVLNLTMGTSTAGVTATGLTTATNYETVNVTSQGGTNTFVGLTASAGNVNFLGDKSITTGTITTKSSGTVDASAMTAGTLTATLTSATTTFKGGAGVDALTLGAGTLAQGYSYDGGAGDNTIAVSASNGQNAGILSLTNFKTVGVTLNNTANNAATFDLRNITNVSNFKVTSGVSTGTLTLNHVKPGQVVTLDGTTAFAAVYLNADSGTTQSLAFNDSLTVTTLNVDAGATALTLSEITGKTATVTNPIVGGSLTSVNLTGAGSFAIGAQASTVTTIDGSALSAGTLTATLGAAGTLKGGAGGDALTGSSGADTINGGAGADTLTTGGGKDTLTGGDTTSLDTFVISGAATGTAASPITITDFATAAANTANSAIIADTLQFKDSGANIVGTGVINAAATNLASAASLADALNLLAAGDGSANAIIAYGTYGGDTYIVIDNTAGATLAATDNVIKLTGVTNLAFADMSII